MMKVHAICCALLLFWSLAVATGEPMKPGVDGVTYPELAHRVPVRFPPIALQSRRSGVVVLDAVVLESGSVGVIQVVRAFPTGFGFEQAAIESLRQWRYRPGTQNGVPVDVSFMVVIEFSRGGSGLSIEYDFEKDLWEAKKEIEAGELEEAYTSVRSALDEAGKLSRHNGGLYEALALAGDIHAQRGESEEAERSYAGALEVGRKNLGKKSLALLELRGKLAAIRVQQERYAEAEPLISESVRILEKDGDHPLELAWWLERQRAVLISLGRSEEAAAVTDRLDELQEEEAGKP
ncbi:MAG: TonB family protein [Acidobacteriota bacterium]|jgi:TonB family protein